MLTLPQLASAFSAFSWELRGGWYRNLTAKGPVTTKYAASVLRALGRQKAVHFLDSLSAAADLNTWLSWLTWHSTLLHLLTHGDLCGHVQTALRRLWIFFVVLRSPWGRKQGSSKRYSVSESGFEAEAMPVLRRWQSWGVPQSVPKFPKAKASSQQDCLASWGVLANYAEFFKRGFMTWCYCFSLS